jgi:hypothetical protein
MENRGGVGGWRWGYGRWVRSFGCCVGRADVAWKGASPKTLLHVLTAAGAFTEAGWDRSDYPKFPHPC